MCNTASDHATLFVSFGSFGKVGVLHFVRNVEAEKIRGAYEESLAAGRATGAFRALAALAGVEAEDPDERSPQLSYELAGQVNGSMPYHVVQRVREALNSQRKSVRGSRVLVLGVAYKADIDDVRESPSLDILDLLEQEGAKVGFSDPYIDTVRHAGRVLHSTPFRPSALRSVDCVVIATAHKVFDYAQVAKHAKTIVDSRNALKGRRTRGVFRL